MINFRHIEDKWRRKWERKKLFEPRIENRKKYFITFPYPYVNGAPHIGHAFTATRADIYARFKRMQGFNVLFPQGFHATGQPILGAVERLRNNDRVQLDTFKSSGAADEDIEKFKKDPKYVALFWKKRWIEDLKKLGSSIDWTRTFITTTLTPAYSRFIEWQYNTLKKNGYVVQGTHPVIWCPKDKSPTGDHDRLEGEGESPIQYVLIKFKFDDAVLPCTTLRPETTFGATNIWLNPTGTYVKALVNREKWIISSSCVEKLKEQIRDIELIEELQTEKLFGRVCVNPLTNIEMPILPSEFVDTEIATGVVMSVPAHAPYDWIALQEIIQSGAAERYGFTKNDFLILGLISGTEFGEIPAKEICDKLDIVSLKQKNELEKATSELYKKEFYNGILNENCGKYAGKNVSDVKDVIIKDFSKAGNGEIFWDCTNVVCRCATKCIVKILENQWFLKYSDKKWKADVKKCISKLKLYPEETRENFYNTLEWMNDKACTRKTGLGTPLPWDKWWIVETLSDSTIYMAYYTISRIINENEISPEQLSDDAFNYIFLNKGSLEKAANGGLNKKIIKNMKLQFDYFYPVDMRISGKDLIQNHFIFYLYHHVAFWPEKKWPVAIASNGHVNVEGEKMSKSKGNFVLLSDAINSYGADLVRINIACSAEYLDDADWRVENIKSYRTRLEFIYDVIKHIEKAGHKKTGTIEMFLKGRINRYIGLATKNYDATNFRTACQYALFDSINDLKWYIRRVGGFDNMNRKIVSEYLETLIKLISPLVPYFAEEAWSALGKKGFVSVARWPESKKIKNDADASEDFIKTLLDDINEIKRIAEIKKIKGVVIFVAERWKFDVFEEIIKNKGRPLNDIIKLIMSGPSKIYGKATLNYIQNTYKKINELEPPIKHADQLKILKGSREFIESEIGVAVDVVCAEQTNNKKAAFSTPQKPGILLE